MHYAHFFKRRVSFDEPSERRSGPRRPARGAAWVLLLIERPEGGAEPLKYSLSTLPEDTPFKRMVYEAMMRWRIERD